MKQAIYPGTFDPITNGHIYVIERGLEIFDRVLVAVADNPKKAPLFPLQERVSLIKKSLEGADRVDVAPFRGLLVDFATERGTGVILRGLRAVSDFEYELQMALMNRKLAPDIDTLYITPSLRYIFLSSTIVKEAASFGGDVSGLVPPVVEEALKKAFGK